MRKREREGMGEGGGSQITSLYLSLFDTLTLHVTRRLQGHHVYCYITEHSHRLLFPTNKNSANFRVKV